MAKITLDLNQFKASGVYTVEFDASERIILSTETIRLVVGFSRKGPFNAPVFLRDLKTARTIFGNNDTFLEKRGSFFHRGIETCLQTGPIFALNLLPLNNVPLAEGGDGVEYRSFAIDVDEENGPVSKDLLASFYNKERFWFADSENFMAIVNNNALNKGRLLNLTNLSQTPMSFIIRKPNPKVNGYALTAREWYGAGNVPDFIYEFDYMEDYFLEVIAIEGDWTDYKSLSEDPIFSKYFDKRGIRVGFLNEFLSLDETTTVANFIGSVIPDFVDGNGSNQFLEVLVNNAVATTGIFLSINRDALDDYANSTYKVDLVGHSLISTSDDTIDFLSYNTPISKAITYATQAAAFTDKDYASGTYDANYIISSDIGKDSGVFGNVLVVPKPAPTQTVFTVNKYQELLDSLSTISLLKSNDATLGDDYIKVDQVIDNGSEFRVVYSNPNMATPSYVKTDGLLDDVVTPVTSTTIDLSPGTGATLFTTPPTATEQAIILVEAPGFKKYFEVVAISTDEITISLSSALTSTARNHSPAEYCSGEVELAELATALAAGTFFNADVKISAWSDYADAASSKFMPNLLTAVGGTSTGIRAVITPDIVSEHGGAGTEDSIEAYPGSKLAKDIAASRIVDGDLVYYAANAAWYINVDEAWGLANDATSNILYGLQGVRLRQYVDIGLTTQVIGVVVPANPFVGIGAAFESGGSAIGGTGYILYSNAIEDLKTTVDIIDGSLNAANNKFRIALADAKNIEVGYFLVNNVGTHLTRVTSKIKKINQGTGVKEYEINTTVGVQVTAGTPDTVVVYTPINDYADRLQFTPLTGFALNEYHLPSNQAQLWKIYGVIENTNLGLTLASKDIISFRYIIDTMKFGIEPMMGPKVILSRLAKQRQKCMAILNAPSIKEFVDSTDPRFTNEPDPAAGNPRPVLNTEYIASGGNLSLGPSFTFSLPDEENGAKFFGAFSPFLTYRENNKNISVPPAADVSNNFIRKFLNGQPYSIVAGPRRGILSNSKLVGLEYEFTLQDREFLEPFGLNPIVTVRNVGVMIYGNQSGYQRTLSAFNNLHVRDLLITVESAIEDVLMQYLFEFNDAATRLEIKSIVENYLENVRNAGGVFDFLVIMDETNNTPATIDQNFGIIDVGLEPARGMQKFVNRVTILKTGAIASGGFTIA
jgi:hypothetical protein